MFTQPRPNSSQPEQVFHSHDIASTNTNLFAGIRLLTTRLSHSTVGHGGTTLWFRVNVDPPMNDQEVLIVAGWAEIRRLHRAEGDGDSEPTIPTWQPRHRPRLRCGVPV